MTGHLILTRKLHESLTLTTTSGERIEVEVRKASKGRCTLAVKAQKSVVVVRTELERAA